MPQRGLELEPVAYTFTATAVLRVNLVLAEQNFNAAAFYGGCSDGKEPSVR